MEEPNRARDHNNLTSSKGIKLSTIIGILLVSFSIFYYLVVFLPQKNNQQIEQKTQTEILKTYSQITNQQKLQECLDDVNKRVSDPKFSEAMKGVKVNSNEAKVVLDLIKQLKDECYKKYPQ